MTDAVTNDRGSVKAPRALHGYSAADRLRDGTFGHAKTEAYRRVFATYVVED